ncbi:MAG: hypothetical protein AAB657_02925 [Patescibacteria group bacterium]
MINQNKICGTCGATIKRKKYRPPGWGAAEQTILVCSNNSTHNIKAILKETIALVTNKYVAAKNSLNSSTEIEAISNLLSLVSNLPESEFREFVNKQK